MRTRQPLRLWPGVVAVMLDDAAIYKVRLDGTVVGKFGSAGKLPKQFGLANSIDCRNEHELLIGEMTNWRVQKVTLKR